MYVNRKKFHLFGIGNIRKIAWKVAQKERAFDGMFHATPPQHHNN
jgi:hypothetical protein